MIIYSTGETKNCRIGERHFKNLMCILCGLCTLYSTQHNCKFLCSMFIRLLMSHSLFYFTKFFFWSHRHKLFGLVWDKVSEWKNCFTISLPPPIIRNPPSGFNSSKILICFSLILELKLHQYLFKLEWVQTEEWLIRIKIKKDFGDRSSMSNLMITPYIVSICSFILVSL